MATTVVAMSHQFSISFLAPRYTFCKFKYKLLARPLVSWDWNKAKAL